MIRMTREQVVWLELNYPHISNGICAMILGASERTIVRRARLLGLKKTTQFMKESQAYAVRRAHESHIKNGTYPPKGVYPANLQKGKRCESKMD